MAAANRSAIRLTPGFSIRPIGFAITKLKEHFAILPSSIASPLVDVKHYFSQQSRSAGIFRRQENLFFSMDLWHKMPDNTFAHLTEFAH
jgi:hypothetical protein